MTPNQRALYGRIGAAVARSRHDPRELTVNARVAFLQRFERQVRAESPDLSDAEVTRRAAELRQAYMLRLALASSRARSKKRTADRAKSTAQEGRDASALPPETA
jgi:hypothetical protein